jgi:hypothetical protein
LESKPRSGEQRHRTIELAARIRNAAIKGVFGWTSNHSNRTRRVHWLCRNRRERKAKMRQSPKIVEMVQGPQEYE